MIDPQMEAIAAYLHTSKVAMTAADPQQPDCPLVAVNSAFQDMTGYPVSKFEGRNCRFLQGGFVDSVERSQIREAIDQRKAHVCILLNFKESGEPFNNLVMLEPLTLSNRKTVFLSCNFAFDLNTELSVISQEANRRGEHVDRIMRMTGMTSEESMNSMRARAKASIGLVRQCVTRQRMAN